MYKKKHTLDRWSAAGLCIREGLWPVHSSAASIVLSLRMVAKTGGLPQALCW